MERAKVAVYLVLFLPSISLFQQQSHGAADPLSPMFSPILNGLCNAVDCGKGICEVSKNSIFGFKCKCNSGWNQFDAADHFSFLPCVLPNCSINSSCSKVSSPAPAAAPFPAPPSNLSLFDPCNWSFCGGGQCLQTSAFDHRCECRHGYSNLLNVSSFPCYRDCSIGADCVSLGIGLPNSPPSSATSANLADDVNSSDLDLLALKILLWLVMLMASLIVIG